MFREVRPGDVEHVAAGMRQADRREIAAAHGIDDPVAILHAAVRASHLVWTCDVGAPIAILGVAPLNLLEGKGIPWMLATDAADRHPRIMLEGGRSMIALWRRTYPTLANFVHAENAKSVRWLKWLGFTVDPAQPFGAAGESFHRFHLGCT